MVSDLWPLVRWALVFLVATPNAPAATLLSNGYSIRVWQTQDGLPQNSVTSAVQTRDGYLWFGTHGGLTRFDGERFQTFEPTNTPGLSDRRISSLFEDADGNLWIGQDTGAVTRYQKGRFANVSLPSEPTPDRIFGIGSDERGHLWAMRMSGHIDSLHGGPRLPSQIAPALPGMMMWARSPQGQIWLIENSRASTIENGRLMPVTFGALPESDYVEGVAPSRTGGVWVLRENRIRKWIDGGWAEDRGSFPWPPGAVGTCLELHDGTLAVGTVNAGLYLVFGDRRPAVHFDLTNGLPQNWVRFIYEDRENNVWVGAGTAGLAAIQPSAISVLNSPDQWQGYSVNCVTPGKDGALWIGTDGGGLYRHSADGWSHYGAAEGLENQYIWAVTETPEGVVWAGNFSWGGPYRLEGGRFVRPAVLETNSSPVFALVTERRTGDLLVGTREGLMRLQSDRVTWLVRSSDFPVADVATIAQDSHGAIWCGFSRGGLTRVADGKVSLFGRTDGLGSEAVQCLVSEPDDTLWIGTADQGLYRYKNGRFTNLSTVHGLLDNTICHILDDGLGYFWMSTYHGLQRVAKAELDRCADGLSAQLIGQIYNHNDGLPIVEFMGGRQATGCRTADGRLWFASSKGLIIVDPRRVELNRTPPPVVFESLVVDGQPLLHGSEATPPLPPEHQRLEFRFSGLSFVAPNKVFFKYRLDGIDQTWIDAGPKRSAFYSRLPAGSYRFRVIACNNDGVWSPVGATFAFTVAPFFWATWWFAGSCALLVLAIVAALVRYATRRRMQKRVELLERQNVLERERARIAKDIHDDIGTSLIRIAMFSQPERNEIDQPQQTAAVLSRIYSTAREMTRALDEIVWAIDPRHDTLDSLVGYMGGFAQELLAAANLRCRLDVPVEVPAWPLTAETRHNLFLAFKEALTNVIKHAAASEVRIALEAHSQEFVLVIRDNGRGFDREQPAAQSAGRIASGYGLRNLEHRLALIGGRCEIASALGKGTTISFVIPARNRFAVGRHRPGGVTPTQP